MENKKLTLMIIALAMFVAVYSFGRTRTVANTFQAGDETYGMELNTDGSLVPMTSGTGALGTSTYKWDAVLNDATIDTATITDPVITNVISVHDVWVAPVAKSSWSVSGTQGVAISTISLNGSGTTFAETTFTMWDVPRTLGCSFEIFKATNWIDGTCTFAGYDAKGVAISEVVICSGAVVTNFTNNAFARLTSVVTVILHSSNDFKKSDAPGLGGAYVTLNIGTGVKLGLSGNLVATTDAIKLDENNTGIAYGSIAALLDATYDTLDPATDPAGTPIEIWYKSNSN